MFLLNYLKNCLVNMNEEREPKKYAFTEYIIENEITGEVITGMTLCPRRFEPKVGEYIPDDIELMIAIEKKHVRENPDFFDGLIEVTSLKYENIPTAYCLLSNLN